LRKLNEKDEHFSSQICTLFNVLRLVEDRAGEKHTPGRYRLAVYHPTRLVHIPHECNHHLFVSWRVHLLWVAELPCVYSVPALVIYDNANRDEPRLDGRIPIDLATRLANLDFFDVRTGGYEWYPKLAKEEPAKHYAHDWEGPPPDSRPDFAIAVISCIAELPGSVKRASLDSLNPLERTTNIDHHMALADLVSPLQKDPISTSLRLISTNLCQLRIRAMIDDSLFWSADNATPFGPNLEVLEVMSHPARPDGKWYFEGPGGEGHEALGYRITDVCYPTFELAVIDMDMDKLQARRSCECDECFNCQIRISPNNTNIRHLLEGFAKAATQMRFLRKALLWLPMRRYRDEDIDPSVLKYDFEECDDLVWRIGYESGEGVSCRELKWVVSQWRPDPE
jgi:hypothetical protein